MTLDATARQIGLKLITKFGKAITYVSVAEGTYSPSTGSVELTTTEYQTLAIVKEADGYQIKNGFCQIGDKVLTIAASSLLTQNVVVATTDKIIIDSETFTIVNLIKIYSGADVVLYKIIARLT